MKTMKQIIVNVESLSAEEKKRMIEALVKIKNIKKCNPLYIDNVAALYGPSFDGINVGFNYHKEPNPTHTPQQVLEMAGMTKNKKVRKDFNPSKDYSVDVSKCTEEEKKEVQQAFFDAGFPWEHGGKTYQRLYAAMYTNMTGDGYHTDYCMFGTLTDDCNMTAKEFLELVYEPENQGHVHAELMAQYAEDARSHAKPWMLWQIKREAGVWENCRRHPSWAVTTEFRRKPKTHTVNGVEIIDLRVTPELEQYYWYPDPSGEALVFRTIRKQWSASDNHRIANNICYQYSEEGKQAAILHAKAMLGI